MANRLLPEWHPQDAIQLTWPSPTSDWAPLLERIEATMEAMVVAIARYQQVLIAVPDTATRSHLARRFANLGVDASRLRLAVAEADDTWARDHGPIAIERDGQPVLLDYVFTGWGGKFEAGRDDRLTRRLAEAGVYACPIEGRDVVLEGGAIDTDGAGTLLTTEACLLNPNRNPQLDRGAVEGMLRADFGIERVLWLANGHLEGDDTDSHVDTLARFCDPATIAYMRCDDDADPHYPALAAMEAELKAFRRADGEPYRLVPLPWPRPCYDPEDGHRLPATYANFLIVNSAVLVPVYGDAADSRALAALAEAFPDRDIVPIDCLSVIRQHGSLHCLTMQLPLGSLNAATQQGETS
ncbi:agmatine deiminase family protein [Halomonas sp. MCCC 1A17488]|uniref:Agmatine deiminase family protein n=1 Tax=Billgrantia sulfidoxydans TaxID=2733484 RepID=A0ABX7W2W8_9GAMM|nr:MULTISPECIES: agmatine deiminase family protein [Halomonas]MCE8015685.1 agmatine deiminase family protein [Halomonas sp. MCCC 1A17488]MCG3239018.1 agmatine deiminase family protein [Halomonas sp. MCCC 1A17488]QPP51031.1 agmatine deiminase family protein [Halomonas sp. SS10-MC5]QTP54543.1 agmatine deiminase family protein [Halomonas sulfidoxydans]